MLTYHAVREEGVGYDLGGLPTGNFLERPEVGSSIRSAWLALITARVTRDYGGRAAGETLDPDVEMVTWRHIFEDLGARVFLEVCRVGDDLAHLGARGLLAWAEVGPILRIAWLRRSATIVARHDAAPPK